MRKNARGGSSFLICAHLETTFLSVQVCSVLESLEQEYRRDEDWCGSHEKLGTSSDSDHLLPLISKHLEQKEAFLKVLQSFFTTFTLVHLSTENPDFLVCEFFLPHEHHAPVLQACTLARRNAEVFLKYIHRNNVSMPGATSHARGPEQQVKGQFC